MLALHCPDTSKTSKELPPKLLEAVTIGVAMLNRGGWFNRGDGNGGNGGNGGGSGDGGGGSGGGGDGRYRAEAWTEAGVASKEVGGEAAEPDESDLVKVCFVALSNFFDCSDEAFYSGEYLIHGRGSGLVMGALRFT